MDHNVISIPLYMASFAFQYSKYAPEKVNIVEKYGACAGAISTSYVYK